METVIEYPEICSKQPTESHKHYLYFRSYVSLGEHRSVQQLADELNEEKHVIGVAALGKIASERKWVERASAHDAWIVDMAIAKHSEQVIPEMLARHADVARKYLGGFEILIDAFLKRVAERSEELDKMPLNQLIELIVKGANATPKLQLAEALSRGHVHTQARLELTGKNGEPIEQNVRFIPPAIVEVPSEHS